MYVKYGKRVLDIIVSILALIVLLPFLCIISILVKISNPSDTIIFKQERCGQYQKPFTLYKFRTMTSAAPANRPTWNFEDALSHITKFGRILRVTSIDELPQIWNVLKGDMSLVGPRPLIFDEEDFHSARCACGVYDLKPGITGLSQIKGRDDISFEKKIGLDAEYCSNLSLRTDLYIIFFTIPAVLMRKGIIEGKHIKEIIENDIIVEEEGIEI